MKKSFRIDLPQWADDFCQAENVFSATFTDEQAMRLAISLALKNTVEKSGGPFGAVVLDRSSSKVLAVGVNRVVPNHCSLAHGEMTALSLAQATLGTYDLAEAGRRLVLFTSAAPCSMCLGGLIWSGVCELVTAASTEDVEEILGYDEGPVHPHWEAELRRRGITVRTLFQREEARSVLRKYKESQGEVYNPTRC